MAHCPDPAHPTACHVHPLQTFAGIRLAGIHRAPARLPLLHRSRPAGLRQARTLRHRTAENRPADGRHLARLGPARDRAAGRLDRSRRAVLGARDRRLRNPASRRRRRRRSAAGPTASPSWSDGGARGHAILVSSDADPVHRHLSTPAETAADRHRRRRLPNRPSRTLRQAPAEEHPVDHGQVRLRRRRRRGHLPLQARRQAEGRLPLAEDLQAPEARQAHLQGLGLAGGLTDADAGEVQLEDPAAEAASRRYSGDSAEQGVPGGQQRQVVEVDDRSPGPASISSENQ